MEQIIIPASKYRIKTAEFAIAFLEGDQLLAQMKQLAIEEERAAVASAAALAAGDLKAAAYQVDLQKEALEVITTFAPRGV